MSLNHLANQREVASMTVNEPLRTYDLKRIQIEYIRRFRLLRRSGFDRIEEYYPSRQHFASVAYVEEKKARVNS
jgi:hypothetical protein